jgi:protoheme IX farnesyltransferase
MASLPRAFGRLPDLRDRVWLRERQGEEDRMVPEKQMFAFSVFYLFALFGALVADRWLVLPG